MRRLTVEEIFAEPDPYGVFDLPPAPDKQSEKEDKERDLEEHVMRFKDQYGRLPDPNAKDIGEMILGTQYQQLVHQSDQ